MESAEAVAGVSEKTVGAAVMELVRAYGIETVFGIPGTHNLEFYRALPELGIHPVTARHEQGAGYGADAWSQVTGKPGVVVTTSGPGLLNALSAAATAYAESRPMLILAPGPARGSEFSDCGTLHETKDQFSAAAAIVAHAQRPLSETEAIAAVHEAFAFFASARPRPVYLEIPLDLLESAYTGLTAELAAKPFPARKTPAAEQITAAARALDAAARPVILAGGGAVYATEQVRALAEHLGAPVVTTLNGKGVLDERHELAVGSELRLAPSWDLVNSSDALLVIGSKIGEAELWGGVIDPAGEVIRVDLDAPQLHKNLRATVPVLGDSALAVAALLEALQTGKREPWVNTAEIRRKLAVAGAEFARVEDALAERIQRTLPEDVILTGDSSQITYYGMASRARVCCPGSFLYMATYATLGYGLPAAIGAKLAAPERPVVGVIGDGALMFSIQELQTAAEQGLSFTIVCVDNGGYQEIKQNEADRGIAPVGVELKQPDWPKVAEAFCGTGFAVTDAAELEATLAEAYNTPGVTLVHVPMGLFS